MLLNLSLMMWLCNMARKDATTKALTLFISKEQGIHLLLIAVIKVFRRKKKLQQLCGKKNTLAQKTLSVNKKSCHRNV